MSADSTCSTSTATSSVAPSTVASSVLPDDDDVLLAFGIPPTPFSIRPRIQSVVNDARVQRDRDLREAAIPRSLGGAEAYRCVVCTLPGGTCEHSDIWARQASRRLLGPEERSSLLQADVSHTDDVDEQLADLMDVVGLCNIARKAVGSRSLTMPPRTAPGELKSTLGNMATGLADSFDSRRPAFAKLTAAEAVDDRDEVSGFFGDVPPEVGADAAILSNRENCVTPGIPGSFLSGNNGTAPRSAPDRIAGTDGTVGRRDKTGGGSERGTESKEATTIREGRAHGVENEEFEHGADGQTVFDELGNPVPKIKVTRDMSRDAFNIAKKLLDGNKKSTDSGDRRGLSQALLPWEIATARGAAGFDGLAPPPPLRNYRWSYPEQRAADKIGDTAVDLSTPCPRGGHSLVAVNSFTLVAFGGFYCQWEVGGVNRPFTDYKTALLDDPMELEDGAHYLNDIRAYDTITLCWSLIEDVRCVNNESTSKEAGPSGRFAHTAILLDASANSGEIEKIYGNETEGDTQGSDVGGSGGEVGEGYSTLPFDDLGKDVESIGGIIWVFGGRCANGVCSNECWMLHWNPTAPTWEFAGPLASDRSYMDEEVRQEAELYLGLSCDNMSLDYRAWPPPRFDAAATNCKGGRYVALSGGRDLTGRNFGDMWLWRRSSRIWEQPLIVGVPPAPRFGHALIALPGTRGEELLILGGCCVSANAVDGTGVGADQEELDLKISLAAQRVANAYEIEVSQAKLAAVALRSDATATGHADIQRAWRGMVRDGAASAAAMASKETATRFEEEGFRELLMEEAGSLRWAQITGSNEYQAVGRRSQAQSTKPPYTQAQLPLSAHDVAMGNQPVIVGLTDGSNKGHNARSAFEKAGGNSLAAFGRTPEGFMDGILIDLSAMVYVPLEAKGLPPPARSHAVVASVGGRVLVFGGEKPLSGAKREHREAQLVDSEGPSLGKTHTAIGSKRTGGGRETIGMEVFVLDTGAAYPLLGRRAMKTGRWRWLRPPAENSPQWLETTAVASEVAVRRAERKVVSMRARARADGAPGGMTRALEEAEAYLRVAEWRARVIRKEQSMMETPPSGRTHAAAALQGNRLFLHGGWRSDLCLNEMLAIDLEQPDERQRRLKEEFAIRLEREVRGKSAADAMNKREREYNNALFKALERERETGERKSLAVEDMLSALPPLSSGPTPRCICANASTIWLHWKPVVKDAWGLPIERSTPSMAVMGSRQQKLDDDAAKALASKKVRLDGGNPVPTVMYYLSMKPGFNLVAIGQRVRVAYINKRRAKSNEESVEGEGYGPMSPSISSSASPAVANHTLQSQTTGSRKEDEANETAGKRHDPSAKDPLAKEMFFSGRVRKIHGGRSQGLFDVQYDDGSKEYRVDRHRIRPEEEPSWQLIYVGPKTQYEAQGLVPEFILQKEKNTAVRCAFCLQTQFTEYTWDKRRQRPIPSSELSLRSRTVTFTTKNLTEEERKGGYRERKFKDAIELDEEISMEITSGVEFETKKGSNNNYI